MIKLEYEKLNTMQIVLCRYLYVDRSAIYSLTPVSTQYTCFHYYTGGEYRDCCLPESAAV